uniref:Uncharacterized protein n=1 Tax=Ditylenchus dipsaci TaxID=166011 RepID=A0A915ERK7_9BILA
MKKTLNSRNGTKLTLGHYEDKIELLSKITDSEKLSGTAIALRGLEAAKQQFQLHGRGDDVSKVILLITNGKHRGNAATVAQDLREKHGIQIFAVAVNPSAEQYSSLSRIVGAENVDQRLLKVSSVEDFTIHADDKLSFIRRSLCGRITPAASAQSQTTNEIGSGRTMKRDVSKIYISELIQTTPNNVTQSHSASKMTQPVPLCRDGFLRPYLMTVIVDVTARSELKDFLAVLSHLSAFLDQKFGSESQRMRLNLITVNSDQIVSKHPDLPMEELLSTLKEIKQERNASKPAKLGLAIRQAVFLMDEQIIRGVNQFIIIISADGLSSDETIEPGQLSVNIYPQHVIAISVKNPSSDLLKSLTKGSSTRVIHFSDWKGNNTPQQFINWISFSMCELMKSDSGPGLTKTTKADSTKLPKWRKASAEPKAGEPSNVVLTPLSPTSMSVSWTCCTNNKINYVILYTPDEKLSKDKWKRVPANCRDSFGTVLENLPTGTDYAACVVQDLPTVGEAATPKCSSGHLFNPETHVCEDINECDNGNGGCSHGCVNTIGDYYCACPHKMMLDPADPKLCIPVAGSFDRITQLLARYLYANADPSPSTNQMESLKAVVDPIVRKSNDEKFKASIKSENGQQSLSFEWPAVMKKAFNWLA